MFTLTEKCESKCIVTYSQLLKFHYTLETTGTLYFSALFSSLRDREFGIMNKLKNRQLTVLSAKN